MTRTYLFFVFIPNYFILIYGASLEKSCILGVRSDQVALAGLRESLELESKDQRGSSEESNSSIRVKDPSEKWSIEIPHGNHFRLDCLQSSKIFRRLEIASFDLECRGGVLFSSVDQLKIRQEDVDRDCTVKTSSTRPEVLENGTCAESQKGYNATQFIVHFKYTEKPYELYSVCHDERTSVTLFVSSFIDGKAIAEGLVDSGGNRPAFKDTGIFPFDVKQSYTREQQFETFTELFGSEDMVERYFPTQQYYLSRGHLFPNGDPIYKYQKDATFYYINVIPQWQITNGGNWQRLEASIRDLASSLETRLKIWTGTFEVLKLADENNNLVEMWMHTFGINGPENVERRLPVPKFLWKVVYDENEKSAVALVQINNPWVEILTKEDLLCEDVCENIKWIRWDTTVTKKGYTYCCDVDSLRKSVPFIPTLNYTKLLDYEGKLANTDDDTTDESENSSEEDDEEYDENEDLTH